MKKTLTLDSFRELIALGYEGNNKSEIDANTIAILAGVPSDKIKKMKPSKFSQFKNDLLEQAVAGKPVYMFKYKGKIFGYAPPEIDTVEAMAAMELFIQQKNWNALAALMFREVSTPTKWFWKKDKHYTDRCGLKVAEINNFPKNLITYRTKKIDFSQIDLDFWDELPVNILLSNLAFSIGNGVQSSLAIPSYSRQSDKLIAKRTELQTKIQELITFSLLQNAALGLECLNSTTDHQSLTANQENSSIGLLTSIKSNLRKSIGSLAWQLTGKKHKQNIESFSIFVDNIASGQVKSNDLLLLSSIGECMKKEAKFGLLWQR